jgi:hypothetical protein
VADVAGQQPAPDGRYGGRTVVLRGDTVQLVDMGTGDFGGDHDSFTEFGTADVGTSEPRHHTFYVAKYSRTNELKTASIIHL